MEIYFKILFKLIFLTYVAVKSVSGQAADSSKEMENQTLSNDAIEFKSIYQPRVAGGRSVHVGDLPYFLQIRYMDDYLCGAALVVSEQGKQVVVTSGRCATKERGNDFHELEYLSVVGGRIKRHGKHYFEQFRSVIKVQRHADFKKTDSVYYHDVAVFHINAPFELNRLVRPIRLPWRLHTKPTGELIIAGWGYANPQEVVFSDDLQVATIPVVELRKCKNEYDSLIQAGIFNSHFCAGKPGHSSYQGSCIGDNGSPAAAIFNNTMYLAGTFNWGYPKCGNRYQPSIYTDLSYYATWIEKMAKAI